MTFIFMLHGDLSSGEQLMLTSSFQFSSFIIIRCLGTHNDGRKTNTGIGGIGWTRITHEHTFTFYNFASEPC